MLLRGDKISLRPFVKDDLQVFQQWSNDLAFLSEFNFFGLGKSNSREQHFLEYGLLSAAHGNLVVETRAGEIAGDVSYHQTHYGPNEGSIAYNIGISLAPEQRGKGYGVEAQRLLAEYLFAVYPVMRVEASTDVTNIPEQRALEKAGFTREGVMRKAQWRNGDWHDILIYSKLRGE